MFKSLRHLLPTGRAWRITVDKTLRKFFVGLGNALNDFKIFVDEVFFDLWPASTRELTAFENQFGLPALNTTEAERRTRLLAQWRALGGQSKYYIQNVLRDAGFDVYVHEWWIPGTEPDLGVVTTTGFIIPPGCGEAFMECGQDEAECGGGFLSGGVASFLAAQCGEDFMECGDDAAECGGVYFLQVPDCATPRSPLSVIRRDYLTRFATVQAGEALAQAGEAFAQAGNGLYPIGYPLVNKLIYSYKNNTSLAGEALMQAGEALAQAGQFTGYEDRVRNYEIPDDASKWAYFLYIGGPNFGDIANLPQNRKDEFERLCLKICPAHLWLGIIVEYY